MCKLINNHLIITRDRDSEKEFLSISIKRLSYRCRIDFSFTHNLRSSKRTVDIQ